MTRDIVKEHKWINQINIRAYCIPGIVYNNWLCQTFAQGRRRDIGSREQQEGGSLLLILASYLVRVPPGFIMSIRSWVTWVRCGIVKPQSRCVLPVLSLRGYSDIRHTWHMSALAETYITYTWYTCPALLCTWCTWSMMQRVVVRIGTNMYSNQLSYLQCGQLASVDVISQHGCH